jgi:hypothetical protein
MLSGWRLTKPIETWTQADFYGADGFVVGETGFRERVEEIAQHRRELQLLPRPEAEMRVWTPWGMVQQTRCYTEGIWWHSTASHGGFQLAPEQNALVHPLLRNAACWYEEDQEWAKIAFTFPDLFTAYERKHADQTLRNDCPDAWEHLRRVILAHGESRTKDERQFHLDHSGDWIVVSAITSHQHLGFVECFAKIGGNRASGEVRQFLVASSEYQAGHFGFVIDEARHQAITPEQA